MLKRRLERLEHGALDRTLLGLSDDQLERRFRDLRARGRETLARKVLTYVSDEHLERWTARLKEKMAKMEKAE